MSFSKTKEGLVAVSAFALIRPPPVAVLIAICAVLSLCFATRSLFLGVTFLRSLPVFDQWVPVTQYQALVEGHYTLGNLFEPHNEHRIVTTRLVLFADAALFAMRGILPLGVAYAALAALAWVVARASVTRTATPWKAGLAFAIAIGFTWAICQWFSLGVGFQVCFPLVHLFAVITLVTFANTDGGRRSLWLVTAIGADFLTVYSLGSGVLIALPVLGIVVLRRRFDREARVFLGIHAILTILYFTGLSVPVTAQSSIGVSIETFLRFLGDVFLDHEALAGGIAFGAWLIAVTCIGWAAIARRIEVSRGTLVLLGMATFIVLEAAAAARFREMLGANPRYDTASMLFVLCLVGLTWRACAHSPRPFTAFAQAATLLLVIGMLFPLNDSRYEAAWRQNTHKIDTITPLVVRGDLTDEVYAYLWPPVRAPWLPGIISFLKEKQLGPFAP